MDIAVFADIHGNNAAFQACVDYCMGKGITNYVLLGDFIGDCPGVTKTMELVYVLRQYFTCYTVRGNREEQMLGYRKAGENGWMKGSGSGALLYTYEQLTEKDFKLFEALPSYGIYNPKGAPGFEYCHGSPTNVSELLFADKRSTKRTLNKLKTGLLMHAHTHVQESFLYREKRALNPGSIGLSRNKNGNAEFAIVHSGKNGWEEELIQVKYDKHELFKEFQKSALAEYAPAWAAITLHTLRTGVDLSEAILLQAMRLCEEDRGIVRWPAIPEQYWAEALRQNYIDLSGKEIPRPKE